MYISMLIYLIIYLFIFRDFYIIQWVPGALSLVVKRPGREADHSSHLIPGSKHEWSYTSTPSIRLHGVVLS
jgi:hypothetical protein